MSFAGKWNVTLDTPLGKQSAVWDIRQAGGGWTGTMQAKTGASELKNMKVQGDTLAFETSVKSPLGSINAIVNCSLQADAVSGICKTSYGNMRFSGVRA